MVKKLGCNVSLLLPILKSLILKWGRFVTRKLFYSSMNIYNNGNLNMWINTFSMPIQSSFSNHPSVHLGNHLLRQIWHSKTAFLHVISLIYYYRLSHGKKMTVAIISETLPSIKSSSWFVRKASILLLAIQNTWTFVLDLVTTRTNDKISLREIGGKVRT